MDAGRQQLLFLALFIPILPNIVSAQAPQKCDLARQTLSHKGPWGTPIPNMCALEITLSGAEKHIIPTHVLECAQGIFSPVLDVFAGTLGIPPAGNERLCYDLKADQNIQGRTILVERGLCSMWKKVRTAMKAGASAIIVADNHPNARPSRMRATKPAKNEANAIPLIPAVMISEPSGFHLQDLVNQTYTDGAVDIQISIRSSYDKWSSLREEVETWDRVLRSKGTALAGSITMLHWNLVRAGFRDDALRASAYAEKLAAQLSKNFPGAKPISSSGLPTHNAERDALFAVLQENGYEPAQRDFPPKEQMSIYQRMVQLYPHVCEIGVSYGFNALAFLQAGAVSYSGFAMPASHKDVIAAGEASRLAAKLSEVATGTIQQMYGNRFGVVRGDPVKSLSEVIESQKNYTEASDQADFQCSLILIDEMGPRTGRILHLMADLAAHDHILILDDTPCISSKCLIPGKVYEEAEKRGEVSTLHRQHFSIPSADGTGTRASGFSVAQYSGESFSSSRRQILTSMRGETYDSMLKRELATKKRQELGLPVNKIRFGDVEELKQYSTPEKIQLIEELEKENRLMIKEKLARLERQKKKSEEANLKRDAIEVSTSASTYDADAKSAESEVPTRKASKAAEMKQRKKKHVGVDDLLNEFSKKFSGD